MTGMCRHTHGNGPPRSEAALRHAMLLGLAVLAICGGCGRRHAAPPAPPPPAVTVATVRSETVPIDMEFVGSTAAVSQVEIRARVEGFLQSQAYTDGTDVKKNQILFEIDPKPYDAALAQAQADLAGAMAALDYEEKEVQLKEAEAKLKRDEATLALANVEVERYRKLVESQTVSVESYDVRRSTAREAAAVVEGDKALVEQQQIVQETSIAKAKASVAAAQAALDAARINLGYCRMCSPIDGRAGARQVDVGNLVSGATKTLLATVVQLDPIYVLFSPSEGQVSEIVAHRTDTPYKVTVTVPGLSGRTFEGEVDYYAPRVDPSTSTVLIRAVLANPDEVLLPGQYVRVTLHLTHRPDALVIPEEAICQTQGRRTVYVVGENDVVSVRPVEVALTWGKLIVIESGLEVGERVIKTGVVSVYPGGTCRPVEDDAKAPAHAGGASSR